MGLRDVRLPIGLKDDQLVHISEVASGLACGCVCPHCHARLKAVNKPGNQQQKHFKHYEAEDCGKGLESALHKLAKQVIIEQKKFTAPAISQAIPGIRDDAHRQHTCPPVQYPQISHHFTTVIDENTAYDDFKPDITAINEDITLQIEIHVTNKVDADKTQRVRRQGEYMVEVDLCQFANDDRVDIERVKAAVIEQTQHKHWISHPQARACYIERRAALKATVAQANAEIARRKAIEQQKMTAEEQRQVQVRERLKAAGAKYRHTLKPALDVLATTDISDWQASRAQFLLSTLTGDKDSLMNAFPIEQDWLINVHRRTWQAWVFDTFIQGAALGSQLSVKEVSKAIVSHFGAIEELLDLDRHRLKLQFNAQYDPRLIHYVFSPTQLESIPSAFRITQAYLNILIGCDVLEADGKYAYTIRCNDLSEAVKRLNQISALPFQERTQLMRNVPFGFKQMIAQSVAQREVQRAEHIELSRDRLIKLFNGEGRLCSGCFMSSHSEDGESCPFCNGRSFVPQTDVRRHSAEGLLGQRQGRANAVKSCKLVPELQGLSRLYGVPATKS